MKVLLDKLEFLIDEAIKLTSFIRFKKENDQHLYAVMIHGSVLEIANGCFCLYRTECYSSVPVLVRAQLEAYVDLRNLCDTGDYLNYMHAAYLVQKQKLIKNAVLRGKDNEYLKDLANSPDLESGYEKINNEITELKKRGYKKLEVSERFEKAGVANLYDSVYPMLCQHSHNNIDIIERRHLEFDEDAISVSYFQEPCKERNLFLIDTIAGVLSDSTDQVFTLLGIDNEKLSDLLEKLAELRATY